MDCPVLLAAANLAGVVELRLTASLSVRTMAAALRWPPFLRLCRPAPGERQRKEQLVHSITTQLPLRPRREQKTFVKPEALPARPPVQTYASPNTSFSLLDRARPVFSFPSGRKRENGGCNEPASILADIHPARQGRYFLTKEGRYQWH